MHYTFLSLFLGSMPYTALRSTDVGSLACSSFAGRSLRPPGNLPNTRRVGPHATCAFMFT